AHLQALGFLRVPALKCSAVALSVPSPHSLNISIGFAPLSLGAGPGVRVACGLSTTIANASPERSRRAHSPVIGRSLLYREIPIDEAATPPGSMIAIFGAHYKL